MPWEGPFAIVTVICEVLCEIQMNRRSKSKMVHVHKLRLTRNLFNMDWVFKLPKKKKKELVLEMDFGGFSELFENLKVDNPVNQVPAAAEVLQQGEVADDGLMEAEAPAVADVAGDEITVPENVEAETQSVMEVQGENKKEDSSNKKTTRSSRKYQA